MNQTLTAAVSHLIDTACHYRMHELAGLYARDLCIVIVDEAGQTITFDYAQNLAFFENLKQQNAPPLTTDVTFNYADIHDGIGYVTATRLLDLGQGKKRIVFTLLLRPHGSGWQIFREHAVILGDA